MARFLLRLSVALLVLLVLLLALALLGSFTPWAGLLVTGIVVVAVVALVERFSWRRERNVARRLRRTSPSRRALVVVLVVGGPAFCLVADLWLAYRLPRYADGNWLAGPVYDLFAAAPFLLVAILLLFTGLSRPAAVLAAIGLAGITALGLWGYGSSDSSTAALSLLAPFLYGFPMVILVFVIDAAVRTISARSTRQAREM